MCNYSYMTTTTAVKLNKYRFECKRKMPIGSCTLISTITAPSYKEALAELLEMFPEVDPLSVKTSV